MRTARDGTPAVRVVQLSTVDHRGGAARACLRLHHALRDAKLDSRLVCQRRTLDEEAIVGPPRGLRAGLARLRGPLDRLPLQPFVDAHLGPWSPNWLPNPWLTRTLARLAPDVIHLHWIASGFVPWRRLPRLRAPLVWTLHDLWPFTGGFHYLPEDDPRLESGYARGRPGGRRYGIDLERRLFEQRRRILDGLDVLWVSPSRWLAELAGRGPLLARARIEVVPNGVDLSVFRPREAAAARVRLGLPQDRRIVLFVAMDALGDPRKGFRQLVEALGRLDPEALGADLALVGQRAGDALPPGLGSWRVHALGELHGDDAVADALACGDAFVAPSLQDNLPNTVSEAQACGLPVVAFAVGGIPEMVEHGRSGWLARPGDASALAEGIRWALSAGPTARAAARDVAEHRFDVRRQAARLLALYEEAISARPT